MSTPAAAAAAADPAAAFTVEWWNKMWVDGKSGWKAAEQVEVLPFEKNFQVATELLGKECVVKGGKALVPLCGDSKVLGWLAEKGMEVVGVEGSEVAVKALKERLSKLPEDVQSRVTVVEGDFFKAELPPAAFDLIYDRGSLVAIDPATRGAYFSVINAAAKPSALCFLETINRPPATAEEGPPHHITVEMVQSLYKGWEVKAPEGYEQAAIEQQKSGPYAYIPLGLARSI